MTELELRLLDCLREYRRLGNLTVRDSEQVAECHRTADRLLALQPELDDQAEHYDAPHRVEHRQYVRSLFFSGGH